MEDNYLLRFVRRITGRNQVRVKSFFEREAIDQEEFSARVAALTGEANKDSAVEHFIKSRSEIFHKEVLESHAHAENFLLLINSAALAGIFTLFDQDGVSKFSLWHSLTVAMFFLSLLFLGLSKWARIVRAHFIAGEHFKNMVRYYSGDGSAFDLVVREYKANGVPSVRGIWAILSFAFFIAGWVFLYFLTVKSASENVVADDGRSELSLLMAKFFRDVFTLVF